MVNDGNGWFCVFMLLLGMMNNRLLFFIVVIVFSIFVMCVRKDMLFFLVWLVWLILIFISILLICGFRLY